MKHLIKIFELFKLPSAIIGYIYPVGKYYNRFGPNMAKETIEEVYEYLYNLGAEPKISKFPESPYFIYLKNNDKIPGFIKTLSSPVYDTDTFEITIDEEKEKEIQLYLSAKKYNL